MNIERHDSEQPSEDESQPAYFSYLLRLWREGNGGEVVWRAYLEDAQTREQHGFASLEELVAFLSRVINREGSD